VDDRNPLFPHGKALRPVQGEEPPPVFANRLRSMDAACPTFDPTTVRHLNRIMGNFRIMTLRKQVYLLSEIVEWELKVSITSTELSTVFEKKDCGRME
jgi:hypothetical protein